jgi:RNA 3'-terminal phosphate cyclase
MEIVCRGFYPKGGGEVRIKTDANRLQARNHVSFCRSFLISTRYLSDSAVYDNNHARVENTRTH